MAKTGRMIYVPKIVLDEIDDLRVEEGFMPNSEAFNKLVKHAEIGREVNRIFNLDFSHKKKMKRRR